MDPDISYVSGLGEAILLLGNTPTVTLNTFRLVSHMGYEGGATSRARPHNRLTVASSGRVCWTTGDICIRKHLS